MKLEKMNGKTDGFDINFIEFCTIEEIFRPVRNPNNYSNDLFIFIEIQSLYLTYGQKIGKNGKLNYITRQCRHKINVHKFLADK